MRSALIVWGGWAGHRPKEMAKAVGELFENRQSATNTACCSAGNCARDCRRTWTRRA